MKDTRTIGEIAYCKYVSILMRVREEDVLPHFADLPNRVKHAWEESALRISIHTYSRTRSR